MDIAANPEEAKWRAEGDARSLAEAEAIKKDDKRLLMAQDAAGRLAAEEAKRAQEQTERAKAMADIGGKLYPKMAEAMDTNKK